MQVSGADKPAGAPLGNVLVIWILTGYELLRALFTEGVLWHQPGTEIQPLGPILQI